MSPENSNQNSQNVRTNEKDFQQLNFKNNDKTTEFTQNSTIIR